MKHLFPLKGKITQDIIDNSNINDGNTCIGANTLRAALGDHLNLGSFLCWGAIDGNILTSSGEILDIDTEGSINFMQVTEPRDVTFIIIN